MNKILNILKNKSNKNIFTLLLGTSTAQAIPVVASLILTRLYTPEEYGVLAVFTSIITILGSIVTLRYELAILVPAKEQDAVNISVLSMISTLLVTIITFIILIFFKGSILDVFKIQGLGNWLFLVPLAILFMGFYNSLNYLATRVGLFKVISQTRVYQTLSGSLTQIILGIMNLGVGGLIIGATLTYFVGNLKIAGKLLDNYKNEFKNVNVTDMIYNARKYKDYPKYNVPSTIFNTMSTQLMSFIVPIFYSSALLGQYSLSQRIIVLPMKVIGSAITQVFLNEASLELKNSATARKTFISTFRKLLLIALPLYVFLFFIIEYLVVFAFGDNWRIAGEISRVLIVMLFFRFIVNPLSNVLNLYERQKIVLVWQFSLVLLTVISVLISFVFSFSFFQFLSLYVAFLSMDYVLMFVICLNISKKKKF
ncbi:O-antigen/teichoic acid export membrane protein [Lederbergia galactosidilyticus]|uniref:lipopolysaccharide biosynthesis protein n=1 Tax=Lederbergia galactosidilytica TaxID=217031 RepID=UPI001AE5B390|nr:oligosaccharide flippase family protein [Lederbergia galactosidilytica]MBP1915427.1 O-antigen/teichoic acid export membrane protein [Lederbergia galactosidilytica]